MTLEVACPDSIRKNSRRETFALYAFAVLICLALLIYTFELWRASFSVLFAYGGDGFQHVVWVKNLIETGWFTANDRFGAPGGQNLNEFPQADALHYVLMIPLTWLTDDACLIVNGYYLLSFPLTVIMSLFVFRRLGISGFVAVMAANVFAFLPFHVMRMGHLFLATYFLVPPAALAAIRLYRAQPPFAWENELRPWNRKDRLAAGLLAPALGASSIYYAAFGCFFFLIAAVAGAARHRSRRPIVCGAGMILGTFLGVVLALLPAIRYKLTAPYNPDALLRVAAQSEVYGLKITQLVLPVSDHRIAFLRRIKDRYNGPATPLVNENDTASLGLLGTVGFLYLLARLLFRRPESNHPTLDILSVLVVFALLLGTIGGFGAVLSYLVSPWIRCYNRISLCIGFFSLAGFALLLERFRAHWVTNARRNTIFAAGMLVLLIAGVREETRKSAIVDYRAITDEDNQDRSFIEEVETKVAPGKILYVMPYREYPEASAETQPVPFTAYDLLRPLVHSKTLRWTFGGLRGQRGDLWVKRLEAMPIPERLDQLALAGFGGVYVDRNAFVDRGAELDRQLQAKLGPPAVVSNQGRYRFYDLQPMIEDVRKRYSPETLDRRRSQVLNPVMIHWRKGFWLEQQDPKTGPGRISNARSEFELNNPLNYARAIRLRMHFDWLGHPSSGSLAIETECFSIVIPIEAQKEALLDRTIEVAPGSHTFRLSLLTPSTDGESPKRSSAFRVERYRCDELNP